MVPTAKQLRTTSWLLAASAWLFVQLGYSFETNDQVQYLLLPYRQMYADFLPGDWFTWQTSHYHVTFAWLVRALHAVWGDALMRYGMLAAHLASLSLLSYGFLRLSRALGGGLLEASLPLLVFGCARESGLGGALLNHGCLLPSDLALGPFLLACAAAIDGSRRAAPATDNQRTGRAHQARAFRRPLSTGVWLGLSGFIHANFAVLGPVVVVPLWLLTAAAELRAQETRTTALRGLGQLLGSYLLLASPSLSLLIGSFLAGDHQPEAVAITLFVRSPHHYDLTYMLPLDFWWVGLLGLLTLPAFIGPYALPHRAARTQLCLLLLALVGLGVLGAGRQIVPLSRLFTFRMSIPLLALWWISLAQLGRQLISRRELGGCVWLAGALAVLALFAREDVLRMTVPWAAPPLDPNPLAPPLWLCAAVLVPIGLSTLALIAWRQLTPRVFAARHQQLVVGALAVIPLALCAGLSLVPLGETWTGARLRAARSFHFADRRIELDAPDRDVYKKARESTPPNASFLIAPGMFEFRMRARRSVFVDWKCAPMKGDEAFEWKRRMLAAMGTSDFPARGYALPGRADAAYYARPLSDLVELARQEKLTHLLVRKSQLTKSLSGAHVVFTSGPFVGLEL